MMLQEITNKGLGSPFTRGGYIDCCAGISGKKYINSLNTSWKEQMLSESGCSDRKRCLYLRTLVNAVCDHGGWGGMRSSSLVLNCIFTGGKGFGEWVVLLKMVKKIIFHVV